MIHVMNFKGEIVDFIAQSDSAVIQAVHKRDINDRMETFDFTILSERTTYMQERNRIVIQDKNGQYREFIIDRISADIDGYTEVETVASYLEDITKARPYAPGKLEKMTTKQALSDVLKDTGWEVSDATEYGGLRTTSWTSYQTRYDVLLQLCTTYDMMADFYIEVGSNRVDKRLVVLRKRNPLFKGKEIEYGKDLTGLKRTVEFSEIKTALLCVGPEPEEGKKRLELVVKDDEAQAKYGLPGRYNWGVYEPETEDQNMTESRLRTLGTTELNKRKSEVITYEVTAVDIEKEYKHEVINLGDMVRIKNRDFTPALYVEAEVISEEYDLISKDVTYNFGTYKEFKESDLRSSFDRKLDAIRQKVSDGLSNVNTIVRESLEGELQYFERKILKGDTPPDNPVNDLLWLDTSNPKVAVLRRYWEGEWIKSSAENASDVGAVTREQALYSELSNTFVNLTIQHSRLMHEVSDVLESEYLIDTDIKEEVNSKLNDTIGVFNTIKSNLDSMTSETATIGKLVDTQALFLEYREKLQALYNTVENAKIAIDERFKLLQSQYTDEKFNEALNNVASKLGLTVNEDNQLVGEVDVSKQINKAVREMTNEMLRDYVTSTEYQSDKNGIIKRLDTSDSERKQLSNQIADRVTRSEYENDVEQRLVNSKAEVLIEAEQTSNRVSKEVFNENSKTLERYTSEFINNVSTGMSFNYDDNGNIQSANVGRDGIKLKGDRVDITVNKDFNVLVNDVSNKADETNIVNKLNLSREGLDINVNNIGIRGGSSTSYVDIRNDLIELSGEYTRTFRGDTQKDYVYTRMKDGLLRFRNNTRDRSLYYSDFGISTYVDGDANESSGTLQFFDYTYSDNARGVTLNSAAGVVALRSDNNRIILDASGTVNIESAESSVYIRPMRNSRIGNNEFRFWVKDNDNADDTDGVISFGSITTGYAAGSSIRLDKSTKTSFVYATNNNGDIGTGDFYARDLYGNLRAKTTNQYALVAYDGEFRVTDKNGATGSSINYRPIRVSEIKTTEGGAFSNHSGKNVYFGVGYNELRITANNFWNGGNPQYQDIRFKNWTAMSHEKYKYDIEEWDYNVLDVFKNELQLHCYKVNSEAATKYARIHHGIVLRDNSNLDKFPVEWRNGDGFDGNEIMFWNTKAIQELVFKVEEQNEKIKELEEQLNEQTTS
ncbi:phage tail spike protein [Staphylococcus pseudintermedius]|uniref:phage tail spike protein n=1 Tax=Staphylococcus pseudintermedius TaxID=283734 RepID=UPI00288855AB|nr:phage tail spike protein [Staphylococcus pseudintermedius]MDT0892821.1 phage tail spike protein [Staphylococcus pseudintermedius]